MTERRVLAFGSWDRGDGYPRGTALLTALRRCGLVVDECYVEMSAKSAKSGTGPAKQALLRAPWRWPGYWLRMRAVRRRAQRQLRQHISECMPDCILVPYPGHLVVGWIRAVFSGPIVLDMFLSAYDTAVVDRRLFKPGTMPARVMRWLDRRASRGADRVLLDTEQNADYVAELVGLPRQKFWAVPVSDPGEPSAGLAYRPPTSGQILSLLFFGTGVPLHGLEHLVEAVRQCAGVRLTLIGGSPEHRARARDVLGAKLELLEPFVPQAVLRRHLERAHLVAGIFGTSDKADRVVPFKVMMALAAGRPVITAHTAAIAAVLRAGPATGPATEPEVITVPAGDPKALAAELQDLARDPRRLVGLARAARGAYEREFSLRCVGARLVAVVDDLVQPIDGPCTGGAALGVSGQMATAEPVA